MRLLITLSLLLFSCSLWGQMPGISASQETTPPGADVAVTVSVTDFEDVVSLQFTLTWDPTILSYQNTDDYALPGLSEFNFGETDVASGLLTFVWFDGQVDGVTLADDTPVFTVTFTAIGGIGDLSEITFTDSPTPIQVGIVDGVDIQEVDGNFTNGEVEIISTELTPQATVTSIDCFGESTGSIDLTVNGGVGPYTYNWTGPNNFTSQDASLMNLPAGEYSLTVTDQDNNTFSDVFTITQPDPLQVDNLGVTDSDCNQPTGSITLAVSGGVAPYSYDFGNGPSPSPEEENLPAGTYPLLITDAMNCTLDTLAEIMQGNAPVVQLGADTSLCPGQSVLLIAGTEADLIYSWTLDGSTLANTTAQLPTTSFGTYAVTVSTPDNCSSTDQIIINAAPVPMIDLGEEAFFCENESVTLSGPSGLTYEWFQDGTPLGETSATLSVSTAGTYSLAGTNAAGCVAEDEVQVSLASSPVVDLGTDLTICPQSTTSLFADPGLASYQWFLNGQPIGNDDMELEIDEGGTYSVEVTNAEGCSATDEIFVNTINFMTAAGPDTTIVAGDTIQLFAIGGQSYSWSTTANLSCTDCPNPMVSLDETTVFDVTITSAEGCLSTETFVVTVKEEPEILIEIVNFLSPNNDGKNDALKFRGLDNYQANQLSIYNRWGDLLYSKPNYQLDGEFWDATFNGQPLPEGVYYYVLTVSTISSPFKSALTIVRD